ncbi:MAG: hypothetical protein Q7T41_03615 [Candidatus Saccharibacteria bacterium]|nr:hypothetical protein [Candidatus Saccharibacteria bacterium]
MRISFGSIAESYLQDPELIVLDNSPEQDPSGFQWDNLNGLRPELYALLAIVIDSSVDRMFQKVPEFPPFGLANQSKEPVERINTLPDFSKYFLENLITSIRETTSEARKKECTIQKKLDHTVQLFYPSYHDLGVGSLAMQGSAADLLLSSGAGTAVKAFILGHQVITRKFKLSGLPESEQFLMSSQNTDLFHRAAGVNIDQLSAVMAVLNSEAGSNATGDIAIAQKPNGLYTVNFSKPVSKIENPLAYDGSTIGEIKSPLTKLGCPARVSLGGRPSAIARLWYLANTSFYKAKI